MCKACGKLVCSSVSDEHQNADQSLAKAVIKLPLANMFTTYTIFH